MHQKYLAKDNLVAGPDLQWSGLPFQSIYRVGTNSYNYLFKENFKTQLFKNLKLRFGYRNLIFNFSCIANF